MGFFPSKWQWLLRNRFIRATLKQEKEDEEFVLLLFCSWRIKSHWQYWCQVQEKGESLIYSLVLPEVIDTDKICHGVCSFFF